MILVPRILIRIPKQLKRNEHKQFNSLMNTAIFWGIAPCSPYVNKRYSETSLHILTTQRYVPDDNNIQIYSCEKMKFYRFLILS
jgi:hypothetical protein